MFSFVQKYKKYAQNLSIYMLASLIPAVVALFTNPFMAMNMSPRDYAITGYYGSFSLLFGSLINFYFIHFYVKRYFELSTESRRELRSVIVKALIYFSLLIALFALLCLFLYTIFFNKTTEIPFWPYAVISVMSIPLTGVMSLLLADYRMQRASWSFFKLSLTAKLSVTGVGLLFVVGFKWGALGSLSSTFIVRLCVLGYCIYICRDLFPIPFNWKIFWNAIKFCYPLVIAAMLSFFSSGYDRVLLERQGDVVTLGIYAVGVSIAAHLNIFSTAVNDTFQPDVFQSVVQRNFKKCVKVIALKVGIVAGIILLFILFAPFLVKVLTAGRYVASTKYAMIASLSLVTSIMYYSISQVTVALGYTQITLINKITGSLLCIIMYSYFINKWGAIGAAWGTVVSFLLFFIGNILFLLFGLCFYPVKK